VYRTPPAREVPAAAVWSARFDATSPGEGLFCSLRGYGEFLSLVPVSQPVPSEDVRRSVLFFVVLFYD